MRWNQINWLIVGLIDWSMYWSIDWSIHSFFDSLRSIFYNDPNQVGYDFEKTTPFHENGWFCILKPVTRLFLKKNTFSLFIMHIYIHYHPQAPPAHWLKAFDWRSVHTTLQLCCGADILITFWLIEKKLSDWFCADLQSAQNHRISSWN